MSALDEVGVAAAAQYHRTRTGLPVENGDLRGFDAAFERPDREDIVRPSNVSGHP
jgi:hypothetical protein